MAVKTYSIDNNIAEKFKDETPEQETSKVLEQLMRDYLDEAPDKEIVLNLRKTRLSKSQQELLEMMIRRNIHGRTTNSLFNLSRKNDIYGRSHHFGEGLKSIISSDKVPYYIDDDEIKADTVECVCEARQPFKMVVENQGECANCGKKFVELP